MKNEIDGANKLPNLQDSSEKETSFIKKALALFWEHVFPLLVLAFVVFGFRSSVFDWYEVPSGSMLPTIQLGDRIFVKKFAYDIRIPFTGISLFENEALKRGEIVVFIHPESGIDFVKRVVAIPGDTVEIRENILYINGQPINRKSSSFQELPPDSEPEDATDVYKEYLTENGYFVFEKGVDDFPITKIPSGTFFVIGDNRDNSNDSRFWGFVPRQNLRGKALNVLVSFDSKSPFYVSERYRLKRSLLKLE